MQRRKPSAALAALLIGGLSAMAAQAEGRSHRGHAPRILIPVDPRLYLDESDSMTGEEPPAPDALRLTDPPMTGARVRALQRALAERGFPPGAEDGVFGPSTDRALRDYQRRALLPETGALDRATAFELNL